MQFRENTPKIFEIPRKRKNGLKIRENAENVNHKTPRHVNSDLPIVGFRFGVRERTSGRVVSVAIHIHRADTRADISACRKQTRFRFRGRVCRQTIAQLTSRRG